MVQTGAELVSTVEVKEMVLFTVLGAVLGAVFAVIVLGAVLGAVFAVIVLGVVLAVVLGAVLAAVVLATVVLATKEPTATVSCAGLIRRPGRMGMPAGLNEWADRLLCPPGALPVPNMRK